MIIIGACIVFGYLTSHPPKPRQFWRLLRGAPTVQSPRKANRTTHARMRELRDHDRPQAALLIPLGLVDVPLEAFNQPTIMVGVPGCGKTSLVNMMLPAFLQLFKEKRGRTRVVYLDVKNEQLGRFYALVPSHVPVHVLNPLDARGSVMDFPNMFPTRSEIDQLAHTICPPVQGDQTPFFRNSARQIIALVVYVLQLRQPQAKRTWGLYELIVILSDKRLLRRVMTTNHEAKTYYRATLGPRIKSSGDLFSTIRSVIQPLIPVALAERDNPKKLNLKEFLRDDGIAILGIPPTASQAVIPNHNLFIRRCIEEAQTISHPDDRLIFFLDEIAMLDRSVVEAIVKATCVGRSHGVYVIAATQSLELLEAQFGKEHAHAFLASCANVVGFRCGSRRTAEYIVGLMGSQEGLVHLQSWSSTMGQGGGSSSYSLSEQLQIRPTVLADEILHLPLADPIADKLHFFAVSPAFGNVKVVSPFVKATTVRTDPNVPNALTRNCRTKSLESLSKRDLEELGFFPNTSSHSLEGL